MFVALSGGVTVLLGPDELGDVLDPVDDVGQPPIGVQHRCVVRAPVAHLEAATLGDGAYEAIGGWEDARTDVRAVMSVSGAYDLETLPWGNFWTPLEGDSIEARRVASPIRNLSDDSRPMLIVHSDDDRSVPIQQALEMVEALEEAEIPYRFVHYTDRGHVALTQEVVTEMLSFIREVEQRGW